ncbi:uncharacterized protein PGTG_22710 [Puccinia graminis f. sp. tritici CRL 75-36-700-3]|uniref:Uncharacterized protein n=1 Tax=Puccinia graminis f. sp. tritici (strain CRL 75-36-700-3 / race SCCL) TaxID=418459 RepID=H6QVD4_PUCGT|nr:uncharacterized protein PGTG_22710 [Puccinia graminis f. sp. tritici CRL 75-36-700-3]EHS62863.1 hypothetical protein PGTG_22710 [Puccinia graminis f. sp. tritici CRL 75-36-700-3]
MPPLFSGQKSPRLLTRGNRPSPAPYSSRATPTKAPSGPIGPSWAPSEHGHSLTITDDLIEPMFRPPPKDAPEEDQESSGEEPSEDEDTSPAPGHPRTKQFLGALEVSAETRGIVLEMGQMQAAQRDGTIFMAIGSVMERLARIEARLESHSEMATTSFPKATPALGECNIDRKGDFIFGEGAKAFFRTTARLHMLEADIEAYSSGVGTVSPSPSRAILTMVIVRPLRTIPPSRIPTRCKMITKPFLPSRICPQNKLNDKDASWRSRHMPPGYIKRDQWAEAQVLKGVKATVKHVRNKARDVIMTGICKTVKTESEGIPNINKLSRYLWKHLNGYKGCMTDEQIDEKISPQQRVRFAYIRLATIENFLDPNCRNISQWDTMDAQLESNRREIMNYTNVWHKLIAERDHELFADDPIYNEADLSYTLCPTHDEVLECMAQASTMIGPV